MPYEFVGALINLGSGNLECQLKRGAWLATWNANPRPLIWTKTADQILNTIASYGRVTPRSSATLVLLLPSAQASTMRERTANACAVFGRLGHTRNVTLSLRRAATLRGLSAHAPRYSRGRYG